jgi:hypothetical protein
MTAAMRMLAEKSIALAPPASVRAVTITRTASVPSPALKTRPGASGSSP